MERTKRPTRQVALRADANRAFARAVRRTKYNQLLTAPQIRVLLQLLQDEDTSKIDVCRFGSHVDSTSTANCLLRDGYIERCRAAEEKSQFYWHFYLTEAGWHTAKLLLIAGYELGA